MKKLISLLISIVMVFSIFAALSINVSATATQIGINAINPDYLEGITAIFTPAHGATLQADTANTYGWWIAVSFAKEGDAYKVVETQTASAADPKGSIAIPEDGFVVASNMGNNYPQLHIDNPDGGYGGKPNYITAFNSSAYEALKLLAVGDIVYLSQIDLDNATIVDNSTEELLWYMDGYVSKSFLTVGSKIDFADRTNVALHKSYEYDGKYYIDGVLQWPDEFNLTLTDGFTASAVSFADKAWIGVNNNSDEIKDNDPRFASFIVDLGDTYTIDGAEMFFYDAVGGDSGIKPPLAIEFFYSADGTTWTSLGNGTNKVENTTRALNSSVLDFDEVEAKFVKAQVTIDGAWAFISELAVYGIENAPTQEESVPPTEESEEPTAETSDVGYIAIAIISMIALAGAIVVKKVR